MTTPTEALAGAIATQDQLREFIGKHGQEDTATFLLIEADAAISALRAALAAPPAAPPVPAGMVLVPVEPTRAMLDAATATAEMHLLSGDWHNTDCHTDQERSDKANRDYYHAMLAAHVNQQMTTGAQPVPATGAQPDMRAELDAYSWRTRGRPLRLSDPEMAPAMARLKERIANDPAFARGLLVRAGICNEDGTLAEQYGGASPTAPTGSATAPGQSKPPEVTPT